MAEKKLVTLTDKNGVRTRRWVNIDEEQSENGKAVSKVSPKVNLNLHLGNGSFPDQHKVNGATARVRDPYRLHDSDQARKDNIAGSRREVDKGSKNGSMEQGDVVERLDFVKKKGAQEKGAVVMPNDTLINQDGETRGIYATVFADSKYDGGNKYDIDSSHSAYYDWDSGNLAYIDSNDGKLYVQEAEPFEPSVSQKDSKKFGADVLGVDLDNEARREVQPGEQVIHPDVQAEMEQASARAQAGMGEYGENVKSQYTPAKGSDADVSGINTKGMSAAEVQSRNREEIPYANDQYPTGLMDPNSVPQEIEGNMDKERNYDRYREAIDEIGSGLSTEQMYSDGPIPTVRERFIRQADAKDADGNKVGAFYNNIDGGYSYAEKCDGGVRVTNRLPGGIGGKAHDNAVDENGEDVGAFQVRYFPNPQEHGTSGDLFYADHRGKALREDQPEGSLRSFSDDAPDRNSWHNRDQASRPATVVPRSVANELMTESHKLDTRRSPNEPTTWI